MKPFTIQQIWNTAWRKFWRNWIPAITLLPLPFIIGSILATLSVAAVSSTWTSCKRRTQPQSVTVNSDNPIIQKAAQIVGIELYKLENDPDEYIDLLNRAKKLVPLIRDSLKAEMEKVEKISTEDLQQEKERLIQAVNERKREYYEKIIRRLKYGGPPLDGEDDALEFVSDYMSGWARRRYLEGDPIPRLDEEDVERLVERAAQAKKERISYEYRQKINSIEQEKRERLDRINSFVENLSRYEEDLEYELEEARKARVSFIGRMWVYFTSLILVILYIILAAIGITILALGPDQMALSLSRYGIRRLWGDIIPASPLQIFLNFLLILIFYAITLIIISVGLWLTGSILSLLFAGEWRFTWILSDLDENPVAPLMGLVLLGILIAFYTFIWPVNYILLSGKSALSALKESYKFMRKNWEVVVAFDISRLFILAFGLFFTLSTVSTGISKSLLDALDLKVNGSGSGGIFTSAVSLGFLFLFIFLLLMRAVLYTELEEGEQKQEQTQLSH